MLLRIFFSLPLSIHILRFSFSNRASNRIYKLKARFIYVPKKETTFLFVRVARESPKTQSPTTSASYVFPRGLSTSHPIQVSFIQRQKLTPRSRGNAKSSWSTSVATSPPLSNQSSPRHHNSTFC